MTRVKWRRPAGLAVALLGSLTACVSPVAMHRAILQYDRTVNQAESEMLLLNLARARHQYPLHFTVTSNVAATFDFRTTAGVVGEPIGGTVPGFLHPIAGISMAESPTVAIVPVQGEEFTKRLLAPIDETKFECLEHRRMNLALLLRLWPPRSS